jgi:hypothetical protein
MFLESGRAGTSSRVKRNPKLAAQLLDVEKDRY